MTARTAGRVSSPTSSKNSSPKARRSTWSSRSAPCRGCAPWPTPRASRRSRPSSASTPSWSTEPECAADAASQSAARASSPASTVPSSTRTKSTSRCCRSATRCIANTRSRPSSTSRSTSRKKSKRSARNAVCAKRKPRCRTPGSTSHMPNTIPNKDRMKMPRQHMPEQDPCERAQNFKEVNLGLNPELAQQEALRCLYCAKPTCITGCPVAVDVKEFVRLIIEGDYLGAAAKIREDNALPAITGRVCPQEDQCEGDCLMAKRVDSLAIGHLERFVADYERETGQIGIPKNAPPTGKKVAIVGSGPAGLSAAGDLIQKGHEVRVFEALHELGGVLVYGIPEFRLPKDIVKQEVDVLRKRGVQF